MEREIKFRGMWNALVQVVENNNDYSSQATTLLRHLNTAAGKYYLKDEILSFLEQVNATGSDTGVKYDKRTNKAKGVISGCYRKMV